MPVVKTFRGGDEEGVGTERARAERKEFDKY